MQGGDMARPEEGDNWNWAVRAQKPPGLVRERNKNKIKRLAVLPETMGWMQSELRRKMKKVLQILFFIFELEFKV
jgi:hypothetical protein